MPLLPLSVFMAGSNLPFFIVSEYVRNFVPHTGSGRTSECTSFYLFILYSSFLTYFLAQLSLPFHSPIVSRLYTWYLYRAIELGYPSRVLF
jgi:hypothetical protein